KVLCGVGSVVFDLDIIAVSRGVAGIYDRTIADRANLRAGCCRIVCSQVGFISLLDRVKSLEIVLRADSGVFERISEKGLFETVPILIKKCKLTILLKRYCVKGLSHVLEVGELNCGNAHYHVFNYFFFKYNLKQVAFLKPLEVNR